MRRTIISENEKRRILNLHRKAVLLEKPPTKVTVGKLEHENEPEYRKETAPDGSKFDLRTDAYDIKKISKWIFKDPNEFFGHYCQRIKKYPQISDYKFKDMQTCVDDYKNGVMGWSKTNFVNSFKVDQIHPNDGEHLKRVWRYEACISFYDENRKKILPPNKTHFAGYLAKGPSEQDYFCGTWKYMGTTEVKGSKESDSKNVTTKTNLSNSEPKTTDKQKTGNNQVSSGGLGKGAGGVWYGTMGGNSSNVPPDDEEREVDFK